MNKIEEMVKKINGKLRPKEASTLEKEIMNVLKDTNIDEKEKKYILKNAHLERLSMIANCNDEKSTQK